MTGLARTGRAVVVAALRVLERATEGARRSLGACLSHRGRIAEEGGDGRAARAFWSRAFYERSLVARPSDVVRARRDGLTP
ncbi:MAG: hypothetical protein AB7S26_21450 [Sandaracinaceae bacterium]